MLKAFSHGFKLPGLFFSNLIFKNLSICKKEDILILWCEGAILCLEVWFLNAHDRWPGETKILGTRLAEVISMIYFGDENKHA